MGARSTTTAAVVLALAFSAVAAAAQDAAPGRSICILPPAEIGGAATAQSSDAGPAIVRMVEIAAEAGGFRVIAQSTWSKAAAGTSPLDLARGPAALRVAASAGADVAVAGFLRREAGGRILVQLKGYDVAGGRIVAAVSARSRGGLSMYNETQRAVDRLILALAGPLQAALERGGSGSLAMSQVTLISPDEGAAVFLGGEEPAGTVTAGAVTFSLPSDAAAEVELRKPGYHTARIDVGPRMEQEVPALVPETWWSAGILVTADRLVGGGITARRYLRPDWLYAGLEDYFYRPFPEDRERGRGLRNDLRAVVGAHLASGPGTTGRVGVAAGVGVEVLNLLGDEPVLFDVYVNAATIGLEINTDHWLAFARVEARYSLPLGDEEWRGTWRTWSPPGSADWALPSLTMGLVRKMR